MEYKEPLPVDIVVVRHGESEGNVLSRHLKNTGEDLFDEQFLNSPACRWNLTERGHEQAALAGKWIASEFGVGFFDDYYVSPYDRAIQTALAMNIEKASWRPPDDRLAERSHGDTEVISPLHVAHHYELNMRSRAVSPAYHKLPNGESFTDVINARITPWLASLAMDGSDSVLAVGHGDWQRAFQMKMEKISGIDWLRIGQEPHRKMWNCQILHYTRRNPYTDEISRTVTHWRTVRPWRESGRDKRIVAAEKGADIWYERLPRRLNNDQLRQLLEARDAVAETEKPALVAQNQDSNSSVA